ncbi:MAG: hypothetical protein WCA08_26200 [Desulfoferrobacter sp.]
METRKLELIQKMEDKGITPTQAAESMGFNPLLLNLYLVKDAYPVPPRILDKLAEVVGS